MKTLARLTVCLWLIVAVPAQEPEPVFPPPQAAEILTSRAHERPIGELIVAIGKAFLGTPYEGGTLETKDEERLVVRFDALDCFTFVENCLALARTRKLAGPDETVFREQLRTIRYRHGRIEGYPSRLHYTTDWGYDNLVKGVLDEVDVGVGAVAYDKVIDYMTTHRDAYPKLADEASFKAMGAIEAALNARPKHYIPETALASAEAGIEEGDVLALTTTIAGLDVAHVGLAIRIDGRLHLLHASSQHKHVEITAEPLAQYLLRMPSRDGVIVYRPREPR